MLQLQKQQMKGSCSIDAVVVSSTTEPTASQMQLTSELRSSDGQSSQTSAA